MSNWTQQFGEFFQTVKLEKKMMFLILLLIILVAVFNLVSSLVMLVNDKQAEIAILRTIGATPATIMSIFVVQGLMVGVVGILIGLIGGIILASNATAIVNHLQSLLNMQILSSNMYFVDYLPSKMMVSDLVEVCVMALIMSFLATLYPAWRRRCIMSESIICCNKVSKTYHDGSSSVRVLHQIDLIVKPGERVASIGPSGSGKSTLLHLLGGLDIPTEGQVMLHDHNWRTMSEKQRCKLRNQSLGFIYQFHYLLPEFTALENVAMPLLLAKMSITEAHALAVGMLEQVGLGQRITHKPSQLSGGERQRVAIARALVHKPSCVLADEPTGNLDYATASHVFQLMMSLNQHLKTALVVVTHDQRIAADMDRVLTVQEGVLV